MRNFFIAIVSGNFMKGKKEFRFQLDSRQIAITLMSLTFDFRLVNSSCLISLCCKSHMANIGNIICQAEVTISSAERHPVVDVYSILITVKQ